MARRQSRRAGGGRDARRAERLKPNFDMLPTLKRNLPLTEPMDQSQIEAIDNASMKILENNRNWFFEFPLSISACKLNKIVLHYFSYE